MFAQSFSSIQYLLVISIFFTSKGRLMFAISVPEYKPDGNIQKHQGLVHYNLTFNRQNTNV